MTMVVPERSGLGLGGIITQRPDADGLSPASFGDALPQLSIPGLNDTIALREQAAQHVRAASMPADRLAEIRQTTSNWVAENHPELIQPGTFNDYRLYDSERFQHRFRGLVDFLVGQFSDIPTSVIDATLHYSDFILNTYDRFGRPGATERLRPVPGATSFTVPMRMSRLKDPVVRYNNEVVSVLPGLRYIDPELCSAFLRNCPPFVIDTYNRNVTGWNGILNFAPVGPDMAMDIPHRQLFKEAATAAVQDATDLAANLGIDMNGLGATLPSVTDFGRNIVGRRTTTGHAGTGRNICADVNLLTQQRLTAGLRPPRVGVLGAGAIGASTAIILAETLGGQIGTVNTYDNRPHKTERFRGNTAFNVCQNEAHLISESDIIVCAITSSLRLRDLGITSLVGKVFEDDGQPQTVSPIEVAKLGGRYQMPLCRDGNGIIQRRTFDYGFPEIFGRGIFFGCEGEVMALGRAELRLVQLGVPYVVAKRYVDSFAVTEPVNTAYMHAMDDLFGAHGIVPVMARSLN